VATKLTLDQMEKFVIEDFEEFVNQRKAAVMRWNMTADFYDHDGPSRSCGYQDNADHNAGVNILGRNEPVDANVSGVALCVV
jgi:hypothetical protein